MRPALTLPSPGIYVLRTRHGLRDLASIPAPKGEGRAIYLLFDRESVCDLFAQLQADPDCIPESEYLTDDDFFETPDGPAYRVALATGAELDDLLYRDPSGDDPGGWLRRALNEEATARGLTRPSTWKDCLPQTPASQNITPETRSCDDDDQTSANPLQDPGAGCAPRREPDRGTAAPHHGMSRQQGSKSSPKTRRDPRLPAPFQSWEQRIAYYQQHKLDSPNDMFNYNDALNGRETPCERRARTTGKPLPIHT